jgi:hypothetical protein
MVTDSADNSPIPGCSVFINGSSRGTATDSTGIFTLELIPASEYELVISAIGYETYTLIFSGTKLPLDTRIRLKRRAVELATVTVEPYLPDGWRQWGSLFRDNFLGTTTNAGYCRLLNRDVLRFRFSKDRNRLTVTATHPLIIDNKALGYRLQYQLEKFTYDVNNNIILYLGYPFFSGMSGSHRQQRSWMLARRRAYFGSMMQFMRELYRDSLQQAGFTITRTVRDEYFPYDHDIPVKMDTLVSHTGSDDRSLFFKGRLKVEYMNSREDSWFLRSEFWFLKPEPLQIWSNGNYNPPQGIFSSGYWSHSEKICNLLPLDYEAH